MAATQFHLHLISDSTGETVQAVARAVCRVFRGVMRVHVRMRVCVYARMCSCLHACMHVYLRLRRAFVALDAR